VLLVLIQTGFISRAAVTERNASEVVLAERCHVLPVLVLIRRVLSWLLCGNGIGLMWITINNNNKPVIIGATGLVTGS